MPRIKKIVTSTKRRQIRRCSVCNKIGHNKNTCLETNSNTKIKIKKTTKKKTQLCSTNSNKQTQLKQPLKLFIHHIQENAKPSEHIVNLKSDDIWQHIQSISPQDTPVKSHHYYHVDPQKRTLGQLATSTISNKLENSPQRQKSNPLLWLTRKIKKQPILNAVPWQASKPKFSLGLNYAKPKISFKQIIKKNKDNLIYSSQNFFENTTRSIKIYFPLRRTVISLVIFSLVIIAPTQARSYFNDLKLTAGDVADNGTAGFMALKDSTTAILGGNINQAQSTLTKALENFDQAVDSLDKNHRWLQTITSVVPIVGNEIKSRQNLISAGHNISIGNTYLLKGLVETQNNKNSTLTQNIDAIVTRLGHAIPFYERALLDLDTIKPEILPNNYQNSFQDFQKIFSSFLNDLKNIVQLGRSIEEIFGGKGLRRYLLVFQNPDEIRPTGGFMGSFAEIDVKDGKIIKLNIPAGGTYDVQGQLSKHVEPPAPLLLINSRWEFQDANWFPDFPASAQKTMWFYRHSRNITVDGVIAINASVLNRILSITGPIIDEKRGVTLTSNNALTTIQEIVESGTEKKEKKPKQILADLVPKFVKYFSNMNSQDVLPILTNLQQSLEQKEVQLYFTDKKIQKNITDFGWSGQLTTTKTNQDYLMVVNTNIGGEKSDAQIKQTIDHQAIIQKDGSIINTVTIIRKHEGEKEVEMYGKPNVDFIRIYAPAGSQLIKATGFVRPDERHFKAPKKWAEKDVMLANIEKQSGTDALSGTIITNEFNKTSFGNWVITKPGQISKIEFIYRLPFKIINDHEIGTTKQWSKFFESNQPISIYQLVVQKQSGLDSMIESKVIYPNEWSPIWQQGDKLTLASNGAMIKLQNLNKDKVWNLIMEKQQ